MRKLLDLLQLTSKAGRARQKSQRTEELRRDKQRAQQAHYRVVTQSDASGRDTNSGS